MGGGIMGEPSAPEAAVVSPPRKVAELAERQRYGPLETGRKGGNPLFTLVLGLVVAGGLFGIAAFINWLVQYVEVKALAFVAALCVLAAVAVTVLTFYLVFRGSTSIYLYAGGFAWTGSCRAG